MFKDLAQKLEKEEKLNDSPVWQIEHLKQGKDKKITPLEQDELVESEEKQLPNKSSSSEEKEQSSSVKGQESAGKSQSRESDESEPVEIRKKSPTIEELKGAFNHLVTDHPDRENIWEAVEKIAQFYHHMEEDLPFEEGVEYYTGEEEKGWVPLAKILWGYLNKGKDKYLRVGKDSKNEINTEMLDQNPNLKQFLYSFFIDEDNDEKPQYEDITQPELFSIMEGNGIHLLKWNSLFKPEDEIEIQSQEESSEEVFHSLKPQQPVPQSNIVKVVVGQRLLLERPEVLKFLEESRDLEELQRALEGINMEDLSPVEFTPRESPCYGK